MDALDQLIASETQSLADLLTRYNSQKIKVDALMAAAAARPAARPNQVSKATPSSGGKPKGAISVAWRVVLEKAYQLGRAVSYQDVQTLYAQEHGKERDLSSIRDRIRNFIESGFITGTPETGFTVTDVAVAKFSFSKPTQASEGNGSLGSDASEPSAQGWGVSPPPPSNLGNPHSGPAS